MPVDKVFIESLERDREEHVALLNRLTNGSERLHKNHLDITPAEIERTKQIIANLDDVIAKHNAGLL